MVNRKLQKKVLISILFLMLCAPLAFAEAASDIPQRVDASEQAQPTSFPVITESHPAPDALSFPISEMLMIRFDQPMDAASFTDNAVILFGPRGIVETHNTLAEDDSLLHIAPAEELLPASHYTLFIDGAANREGLKLSFTAIGFVTVAINQEENTTQPGGATHLVSIPQPATAQNASPADNSGQTSILPATGELLQEKPLLTDKAPVTWHSATKSEAPDDEEMWIPASWNYRGQWTSGRAHLAELSLPRRLEALRHYRQADLLRDGRIRQEDQESQLPRLTRTAVDKGVTAFAGQTLKMNGKPLPGVTIRIGALVATTDDNGEFLIKNVPAGVVVLEIDGRSAGAEQKQYGRYFYQTWIDKNKVNTLPQPIWMTRLDTEHAVKIPSPTTEEVVITNPYLPGMEVRIPPGAVIRDADGKIATEVSLTPVPSDQTPFPMPYGEIPVYYTIQPGGGAIESTTGKPIGAKVIYPNYSTQPPGAAFDIFDHDPKGRGWYVYGRVKVSQDGKFIEGDQDFILYQFQGSSAASSGPTPPDNGPPDCDSECCNEGGGGTAGDPVSCASGLFIQNSTDLYITDTQSINLTRTYRNEDPNQRGFGVGNSHRYNLSLYLVNQRGYTATQIDLILNNGGRISFFPTGTDINYQTATYQSKTPGKFYGATIKHPFHLTLKDGTRYEFSWYNSQLMAIQDRWGNRLGIVRDVSGRILQVSTPNGRFIRFQYGAPNCSVCVTHVTDNINRQVNYQYDDAGRLIKVTNPLGEETGYDYDAATGRMVTVRDPRYNAGQSTQPKVANVYYTEADGANLNGRVKKQTYADGSTMNFAYTFANDKIARTDVTDGRGNIRRIQYNDEGQIVQETFALGKSEQQTITNVWDETTRQKIRVIDNLSRITAYEYDELGNVTRETRMWGTAEAISAQYAYTGAYNKIASITDALGRTTHFTYDAKGNLIQMTDANGHATRAEYDTKGRMTKATNALNQSSFFSYSDSELVKITDPLNHSTTIVNDAIGRAISTIDPSGHADKTAYDALGRATQNQNPMGQSTQYAYDAGGNRTQVINALGNIHRFGFDSRNNITAETDPLGQSETYQYDANRNLIKKTDRKGQATQYAYDALNRLTQITYADHSSVTFTYDGGNRVTRIADSQNGTITNTWDNFDRLTQQTTAQGTVNYTYYPNGLRKTMSATGQPTLTYTYDDANRLTRIDQAAGTLNNNQAQYISFTYDAANKRTQTRLINGQTINYAYDAAGQLTNITYKNADGTEIGNLTYAYDLSGQRISVGGSLARTDLPEDNQSTTDAANRLTGFNSQSLTYDANGNLTGDGINTYTWNARNQLIQMAGAVNAGFTYDAAGRRKSKTVNGQTTNYLYDGDNILQEQAGASLKAGYLMGGIDEIFTRQTPGLAYNYLTDALGSVIRLTDNTGNKLVDYTYDPYGNTAADAIIDNPFQYTGRENDQTGLYYYRARYYSPTYQRFISEDPIGLSGGINVYAYVEGDPISLVDPFGLDSCEQAITAGGFIMGWKPCDPPERPTWPPFDPPDDPGGPPPESCGDDDPPPPFPLPPTLPQPGSPQPGSPTPKCNWVEILIPLGVSRGAEGMGRYAGSVSKYPMWRFVGTRVIPGVNAISTIYSIYEIWQCYK